MILKFPISVNFKEEFSPVPGFEHGSPGLYAAALLTATPTRITGPSLPDRYYCHLSVMENTSYVGTTLIRGFCVKYIFRKLREGHEMKTVEETMSRIHLENNHRKINTIEEIEY